MFKVKVVLFIALSASGFATQAANVTQINRYATVANKPLPAQINPLSAIQQIRFSQNITTIADAVDYWLQYSGYKLAPKEKQPSILQTIMNKKLPQTQRSLGPMSIRDGLEVLVGSQVFILLENPLIREVNFRLRPVYQQKGNH